METKIKTFFQKLSPSKVVAGVLSLIFLGYLISFIAGSLAAVDDPHIDSITPDEFNAHAGVIEFTLNGSNFGSQQDGGYVGSPYGTDMPVWVKEWSDTQIVALYTNGPTLPKDAQKSMLNVVKTSTSRSNAVEFTWARLTPEIISVSPTEIPLEAETTVTVSGRNFGRDVNPDTNSIYLSSGQDYYSAVPRDVAWSDTSITFKVGPISKYSGSGSTTHRENRPYDVSVWNKLEKTTGTKIEAITFVTDASQPAIIQVKKNDLDSTVKIRGENLGTSGQLELIVHPLQPALIVTPFSWTNDEILFDSPVTSVRQVRVTTPSGKILLNNRGFNTRDHPTWVGSDGSSAPTGISTSLRIGGGDPVLNFGFGTEVGTVQIDGRNAIVSDWSETGATFMVPARPDIIQDKLVPIVVTNVVDGSIGYGSLLYIAHNPDTPMIIDSITPNRGPGGLPNYVTVHGHNFYNIKEVFVGDHSTSILVDDDPTHNTIAFKLPGNMEQRPATVDVKVVAQTTVFEDPREAILQNAYTVYRPVVTSVSPNSGSKDQSQTVTITGSGFGSSMGWVAVGKSIVPLASGSSWSDTSLRVVLPAQPWLTGSQVKKDITVIANDGQTSIPLVDNNNGADSKYTYIVDGDDSTALDRLRLGSSTFSLVVGSRRQISVTAYSADNTIIGGVSYTYSSNHPTIATVSSSGNVTAVASGTATITITGTKDGISKQATVTVTVQPDGSDGDTPPPTTPPPTTPPPTTPPPTTPPPTTPPPTTPPPTTPPPTTPPPSNGGSGQPLPSSGPEDFLWIGIALLAMGMSIITYRKLDTEISETPVEDTIE
jgi:hypothetical protein